MGKTTIRVTQSQKASLIEFRSRVEQATGQDIPQGEAVERAARLASYHLKECGGDVQ